MGVLQMLGLHASCGSFPSTSLPRLGRQQCRGLFLRSVEGETAEVGPGGLFGFGHKTCRPDQWLLLFFLLSFNS